MEKQRKIKILSIIALVLAITGMTLGFAAFSTTLSISASAIVTPSSDDFKVVFSSSSTGVETNEIIPISGEALATSAKVNGLSLSDIQVSFSEPGQAILYEFYIYNAGKYDAYITDVNFGSKTCVAEDGTTESLMQQACDDIYLTVAGTNLSSVIISESTVFHNFKLEPGESKWLEFGIQYPESGNRADGPFNISFDDVTFNVSTVDNSEINFIVYVSYDETTYNLTAAKGMKWADWLESDYNDGMCGFEGDQVSCMCSLKDTFASDLIEEGKEYVCE